MANSLSQLTLRDLLDAGLHYGHQTKRWNPKMKPYIFEKRNGIHIIDITQSLERLEKALEFVKVLSENGRKILFVGTKKQAQEVVKQAAEQSGSFYMTNRWLGGTLTNAQTLRKSVRRMRFLEATERNNGGELSPHKKEAASLRRELDKLQQNLIGVAEMDQLPAAVFVVDVVREKNAVSEAVRLGIPVIAIVDTNANPDPIAYGIPGNDDSIRSIKLISDCIASVIKTGSESWNAKVAEEQSKASADRAAKRAAGADIAAEKGDVPAGDKPRRARAPRTGAAKTARAPRVAAADEAKKAIDKAKTVDARRAKAVEAAKKIKEAGAKAVKKADAPKA